MSISKWRINKYKVEISGFDTADRHTTLVKMHQKILQKSAFNTTIDEDRKMRIV